MKLQRGEQADNPARDAATGLDEGALFARFVVLEDVQPATRSVENTLGVEFVEVGARDADGLHVLRPEDARLLQHSQNLVSLGGGHRVTTRLEIFTSPDIM
jgi:hypothetical protein